MNWKRIAQQVFKSALALGILAILFFVVDLSALQTALSQLSISAFSYLMMISFVLVYISSVKWELFIESFGASVTCLRLFALYLLGYFINLLVPSYVGGDLTRSYYLGKDAGQHEALASTLLERYTGFVAMMILGVLSLLFVPELAWSIRLIVLGMAAGLVALTVLALWPRVLQFEPKISWLAFFFRHARKIQAALHLATKKKGLLLKTLGLSFVFHSFTVVNVLATAWVIGWKDAPILDMFAVLPIVLLIGALPITPAGLGIQEGAFFYFLQTLGATEAQALAVGLVLRAKIYVLALFGGLVWIFFKKPENRSEQ
jgi:uncharacterized protein (TIRG00374 family)